MWKSISVKDNEYIIPLNRSDTVLHDALHTVRASDSVSLSERCVSRNHQAGLPWDQNRAQRGVYGCLPQCGCQDKHWGSAAYPDRTETLGTALQGRMYKATHVTAEFTFFQFYLRKMIFYIQAWNATKFLCFFQSNLDMEIRLKIMDPKTLNLLLTTGNLRQLIIS